MTDQRSRYLPLVEALAFSAFVGWYIWQLQEVFYLSWIVISVWLVASFLLHKDTPQSLGLRTDNVPTAFKNSALVFLPCIAAIVVVGLFLGAAHRPISHLLVPRHFFGYMMFCFVQQMGLNSLVTNRLLASTTPLRAYLIAGAL